MTIELIHYRDCPHVAETRTNLRRAREEAGRPAEWVEWERPSPASPAYAAFYGSPTVLVCGQDVAGAEPARGPALCRLYAAEAGGYTGAPSVALIRQALLAAEIASAHGHGSGLKGFFLAAPGVVLAAMPVGACPACWPLYAGTLSAFGLGFLLSSAYLLPVTGLFLFVAVASLAYGARKRRGYGPFAVGTAAAALVLAGKFMFQSEPAAYAGVSCLFSRPYGTSGLGAWPPAVRAALGRAAGSFNSERHWRSKNHEYG